MLVNLDQSNPQVVGKILLGLGKSYEDQIIKKQSNLKFVKWFPENHFFSNHFISHGLLQN